MSSVSVPLETAQRGEASPEGPALYSPERRKLTRVCWAGVSGWGRGVRGRLCAAEAGPSRLVWREKLRQEEV